MPSLSSQSLRALATAIDAGMSLEAFVADPRLRATLPNDAAQRVRQALRGGGLGSGRCGDGI